MQTGTAIEVTNISRRFETGRRRNRKSVEAVRNLSFDVASGERLAFIGPNGAGKSTTIKMLTGLLYPSEGTATVLGIVPWEGRKQLALRIGTLFGQRSQLWQELPALDSFGMLGAIYGLEPQRLEARVGYLGELLGAAEFFDRPVRTLSLGQRMRCELAACMLHEPDLLFLDEPTIGLDLLGKRIFREMLVHLNTEVGTTVFLTSHDVADIEHVADRAVVINDGQLIYDDTVRRMRSELLATKRLEITYGRAAEATRLDALAGDGITVVSSTPDLLIVDVDTALRQVSDVLAEVLSIGGIVDLSVVDPPLEEVIEEIYEGRL